MNRRMTLKTNMKLVLTLGICNEGNGGGRPFPGSKGAIRCALFVFVHSGTLLSSVNISDDSASTFLTIRDLQGS